MQARFSSKVTIGLLLNRRGAECAEILGGLVMLMAGKHVELKNGK